MLTLSHLTHVYRPGDRDYGQPVRLTRSALRHVNAAGDSDFDAAHWSPEAGHAARMQFSREDTGHGVSLRIPYGTPASEAPLLTEREIAATTAEFLQGFGSAAVLRSLRHDAARRGVTLRTPARTKAA